MNFYNSENNCEYLGDCFLCGAPWFKAIITAADNPLAGCENSECGSYVSVGEFIDEAA